MDRCTTVSVMALTDRQALFGAPGPHLMAKTIPKAGAWHEDPASRQELSTDRPAAPSGACRPVGVYRAVYRVVEEPVAAPPLDGAIAGGCIAVSPTVDPGCWVGFSVPAACGRPFVVFGVDWLEFPAGGFCVVVNEFCANAGAAPRITSAVISVFMIDVPLLLIDLTSRRAGLNVADPPWFRSTLFLVGLVGRARMSHCQVNA